MTTDQKGLDDPNALPSFAIPELSDRAPSTQKAEGTADTDRLDPERDKERGQWCHPHPDLC